MKSPCLLASWRRYLLALRRVVAIAGTAATLTALAARAAEAAPIIEAPFAIAEMGDIVTIPVVLAEATEVTSWQFDLSFDPAIVQAVAVMEGPFMSDVGLTLFSPGVIDNATGLISLVTGAYTDLPPSPSGDGVLARIQFIALAPGVSPLMFSHVFLNLSGLGFDVIDGQISVGGDPAPTPVPEPATMALMASGLALLQARRLAGDRRRKAPNMPRLTYGRVRRTCWSRI